MRPHLGQTAQLCADIAAIYIYCTIIYIGRQYLYSLQTKVIFDKIIYRIQLSYTPLLFVDFLVFESHI